MIDEQEEEGENGLIDEEEIEESFRWEPDIGILWESARDGIEPLFAEMRRRKNQHGVWFNDEGLLFVTWLKSLFRQTVGEIDASIHE